LYENKGGFQSLWTGDISPMGFHVLSEDFNPNDLDFPRNLSKMMTD